MKDLIMKLRESALMTCETRPLAWEAADAIEALDAELYRAKVIIAEQARANQVLRKIIQNERE